jgi:hypothetical protein
MSETRVTEVRRVFGMAVNRDRYHRSRDRFGGK